WVGTRVAGRLSISSRFARWAISIWARARGTAYPWVLIGPEPGKAIQGTLRAACAVAAHNGRRRRCGKLRHHPFGRSYKDQHAPSPSGEDQTAAPDPAWGAQRYGCPRKPLPTAPQAGYLRAGAVRYGTACPQSEKAIRL